jgi:hypothetical protein
MRVMHRSGWVCYGKPEASAAAGATAENSWVSHAVFSWRVSAKRGATESEGIGGRTEPSTKPFVRNRFSWCTARRQAARKFQ